MEPSFSQRRGLKPRRKEIQIDSIDTDLQNGLWNQLDIFYWTPTLQETDGGYHPLDFSPESSFFEGLWVDHFKFTMDSLSDYPKYVIDEIRKEFFTLPWNGMYDLLEFVANRYPDEKRNAQFIESCNKILEREVSAYRFVGGKITQITSQEEIAEIEKALDTPLVGVRTHLETALKLFADTKNPDYRNSIKESISAVESLCKVIAKKEKVSLSDAIGILGKNGLVLHGALKKALLNLYGYTSDGDGIRHPLLEEPSTLKAEDAKFMLVACSAFTNYLTAKANTAHISLGR